MSLRPGVSRAAPSDRYVLSLAHGASTRRLALPPAAFFALVACLPALAAVYLVATAYLFFRDDLIAALMARQAHQQYAYEDRLAALRLQLDRVTSRQMLDQDSFDGKLRDIVVRQARIETRAAVIASLGDMVQGAATAVARAVRPAAPPSPPLAAARGARPAVAAAPAIPSPEEAVDNPEPARPRPEDSGLRPSADAGLGPRAEVPSAGLTLADAADDAMPARLRVATVAASLDEVDRAQVVALRRFERPIAAEAARLRAAIAETGLPASRLKPPARAASAVGGPFVAARVDPNGSPFEAQLARTQDAMLSLDASRRLLPSLPIRKPLAGELEQTSGFGYRVDPFLGRPALHSGLDFRGEWGAPVRAAAGGVVTTAGSAGGYGNLVEIDHGGGLATRYGHLSAIAVAEGQTVEPGAVIGRVGSTGRSTGPHLHYEVRIDDEAVDPSRFIRAAKLLASE